MTNQEFENKISEQLDKQQFEMKSSYWEDAERLIDAEFNAKKRPFGGWYIVAGSVILAGLIGWFGYDAGFRQGLEQAETEVSKVIVATIESTENEKEFSSNDSKNFNTAAIRTRSKEAAAKYETNTVNKLTANQDTEISESKFNPKSIDKKKGLNCQPSVVSITSSKNEQVNVSTDIVSPGPTPIALNREEDESKIKKNVIALGVDPVASYFRDPLDELGTDLVNLSNINDTRTVRPEKKSEQKVASKDLIIPTSFSLATDDQKGINSSEYNVVLDNSQKYLLPMDYLSALIPSQESEQELIVREVSDNYRNPSPIALIGFFGNNLVGKSLTIQDPAITESFDRRREEEKVVLGQSAGVEVRYAVGGGYGQAGVNIIEYGEQIDYAAVANQWKRADYTKYVVTATEQQVITSSGGWMNSTTFVVTYDTTTTTVLDSSLVTIIDSTFVSDYSSAVAAQNGRTSVKYVEVPLLVGASKNFGRLALTVSSGCSIGYLYAARGYYLNERNTGIEDISSGAYHNKFVVNYLLRIGLGYSITENIAINLSPNYRLNLRGTNSAISQRYQAIGLNTGLVWSF